MFAIGGRLWRVNADGSGLRRMTGDNGKMASAPEFSPDGRMLAYVDDHHDIVTASGPGTEQLTEVRHINLFDKFPLTPTGADNWDIGPYAVHWSPDGGLLLVTRRRIHGSGYTDVMLMKPDGSERRTLLGADRLAASFPEATWSASHAPDPGPPVIVVVGGRDGTTVEAYDLQGDAAPAVHPAKTMNSAVATHQDPAGDDVLVASSVGSPEPFRPIVLFDVTGASSILAGGCGATWSPDGKWISYYDGYGIAVQSLNATSPDDYTYAVRNSDIGLSASRQPPGACDGVAITWRTEPFGDGSQ